MSNILSRYLKKRAVSRARKILRTHRAVLRAVLDLENHKLVGLLEEAGPPQTNADFGSFIPPSYHEAARTCLRQRCLTTNYSALLSEISKHVVDPGAPLVLPIPKPWRSHLKRQGLNVSRRSQLQFIQTVVDTLVAGLRAARLLILAKRRGWLVVPPHSGHHAFVAVSEFNLPATDGEEQRKNFHSWCRAYYGLEESFPFVAEDLSLDAPKRHGVNGVSAPRHFPPLPRKDHRRFVWEMAGLTLRATLETLTGRWWFAMLLAEAVHLAYFRRIADTDLARRYVFHTGSWQVRPLWTYDAVARGSDVVNVFYSMNFITFTPNRDIPAARTAALAAMSWPEIICPDELSRKTLIEYGIDGETLSVSPIPIDFIDSGAPLPTAPDRVLMIFDVPPYRPYFKATRGFHNAYYTPETWARFIDDIMDCAARRRWTVALKTKRRKHRFNAPAYERRIQELARHPNIFILDASIGASRALTIADAVVSMPFTSPSIVASQEEKPSVFYDPDGALSHYSWIARGLPMLTSSEELDAWLRSLEGEQGSVAPTARSA